MDEVFSARADGSIHRTGATVRRPLQPWSGAVHALLAHLESVGFAASPRLIGVENDVEVLTFLPAESGADGWAKVVDEDGLHAAARLLPSYHDAVGTWRPADAASLVWANGSVGAGARGTWCGAAGGDGRRGPPGGAGRADRVDGRAPVPARMRRRCPRSGARHGRMLGCS